MSIQEERGDDLSELPPPVKTTPDLDGRLHTLENQLLAVQDSLRWDLILHKDFDEQDETDSNTRNCWIYLVQLIMLLVIALACCYVFADSIYNYSVEYKTPPVRMSAHPEEVPYRLPAFYLCVVLREGCYLKTGPNEPYMNATILSSNAGTRKQWRPVEHNITVDGMPIPMTLTCALTNALMDSYLEDTNDRLLLEFGFQINRPCAGQFFDFPLLMMQDHRAELKYEAKIKAPLSPSTLQYVITDRIDGFSVEDWSYLSFGLNQLTTLEQTNHSWLRRDVRAQVTYDLVGTVGYSQQDLESNCTGPHWCHRTTDINIGKKQIVHSYDEYMSLTWYSPVVAALAVFGGTATLRFLAWTFMDRVITGWQKKKRIRRRGGGPRVDERSRLLQGGDGREVRE